MSWTRTTVLFTMTTAYPEIVLPVSEIVGVGENFKVGGEGRGNGASIGPRRNPASAPTHLEQFPNQLMV